MPDFDSSVIGATKWSALSELATKLVMPVTGLVLARVLEPDAFGVVASITVLISFVEIFSDAGFQKYLIQHEFDSETDLHRTADVAYWCNLLFSVFLWLFIVVFRTPILKLLGCEGLDGLLVCMSLSIPILSLSSVRLALFKRKLDFKTLFKVRTIGLLVPLLVTLPLAFWLRNCWALVIGSLTQKIWVMFLLILHSEWKPSIFFSFDRLKMMFSFTAWSIFESVSIWLTSYLDLFLVGSYLSHHYLGIYKSSSVLVGHVMGLVTSATTPVLFASLSRMQKDKVEFDRLFFFFQRIVSLLVFPLGFSLFFFHDFITYLLLGEKWMESAAFIGWWGISSAFVIVFSHYCSEVYRSIGKPGLSVLAQWLHLIVLIPVLFYFIDKGFEQLCIARSLVRLEFIFVHLVVVYCFVRLSPWKMFLNVLPSVLASLVFPVAYYLIQFQTQFQYDDIYANVFLLIFSFVAYICIILLFPRERKTLSEFKNSRKL